MAGENPYHPLNALPADGRLGNNSFQASGFVYPPLLAVILPAPIAVFSLDNYAMAALWALLMLAAVVWMERELNAGLRGRRDWTGTPAFAAAAVVPSLTMYDLWLRQANVLLAALAVIGCALWTRRNPWAPLVLGAAVAVKYNLALVPLVWLWKGDRRAALRGAAAALGEAHRQTTQHKHMQPGDERERVEVQGGAPCGLPRLGTVECWRWDRRRAPTRRWHHGLSSSDERASLVQASETVLKVIDWGYGDT